MVELRIYIYDYHFNDSHYRLFSTAKFSSVEFAMIFIASNFPCKDGNICFPYKFRLGSNPLQANID